jgi:hypothetical protein
MSAAIAPAIPERTALGKDMIPLDAEVIEVAILLPRWQAVALESAAKQRGMSAGQMLRRMIGAAVGVQAPAGHQ